MRIMMKVVSISILATGASAQDGAWDRTDYGRELAGSYTIVSGEKGGEPIPAERIKGHTVRITPDTIVVSDRDKNELYVARYILNTEHEPYLIKMTQSAGPQGAEKVNAQGLIERQGERVRLIYSVAGGELPTGFETTQRAGQHYFLLERIESE